MSVLECGAAAMPHSAPSWSEHRQLWAAQRLRMQTQHQATKRYGGRNKRYWYGFYLLIRAAGWGLRRLGQYERGVRNAHDFVTRPIELQFGTLPEAFDGFTILHLSDLHLDGMSGIENRLLEALGQRAFDLCVLTGDYRSGLHGPIGPAMNAMQRLVSGLRPRLHAQNGIVAVLGNHDGVEMVEPMEAMGIRMLVNEPMLLERGSDRLQIIGTDDVHYYRTERAVRVLEAAGDCFTIVLVHSPELCDAAAAAGASLYLCGHTHGGQICLPGGFPLIRQLRTARNYYRGVWRHRGMHGITSSGIGTSGIPVRFNTRPEIIGITLMRSESTRRAASDRRYFNSRP